MKRLTFILFFIYFGKVVLAQESVNYTNWTKEDQKIFEHSMELFDDKNFAVAYDGFEKLLNSHSQDYSLKYLTGICGIYRSDKHSEAQNLLNDVYKKNKKAANIDFYFALLHHRLGEFEKSLGYIQKFKSVHKPTPEQSKILNKLISNCNSGLLLVQNPIDVRISNIGSPPNSQFAEYAPVISADEQVMIYTYRGEQSNGGLQDAYGKSDKYGFFYEDVFISYKENGKWQKGSSVSGINTKLHDAAIALSSDGQQLFTFKDDETGGGDIFISTLQGANWSEPEKLKGVVNSASWEGSASLSANGQVLYFASERPGGFGGRDLYRANKLQDNTWGNVINLGNKINTEDDDDSPYIHPDGLTLVFSSKGHNSMGGYDIFKTDFNEVDSVWSEPLNIGFPVNTTDDDIYYVLSADGKRGYFASGKDGGFGDKDIYVVEPAITGKKTQLTMLSGIVTKNNEPSASEITVYFKGKNKNYGVFHSNSKTGHYLINLPSGYEYKITFHHPDLGEQFFDINTKNANSFTDEALNVNFTKQKPEPEHDPIIIPGKVEPELTNSFKNYEPDTVAVQEMRQKAMALAKSDTSVALSFTKVEATPEPLTTLIKDSIPAIKKEPVKEPVENITPAKPTEEKKQAAVITASSDKAKSDRLEMIAKYGSLKIENLKYIVQVAAYRHPENYKSDHLNKVATIKQKAEKIGDISLFEATTEFDTWKEADDLLNTIKQSGQQDAFLTVMYNGTRLYLKDLVSKGIWAAKAQVQ
ncbi:MAG: hypothetical protein V4506_01915 [Bacteroidota bacterium]